MATRIYARRAAAGPIPPLQIARFARMSSQDGDITTTIFLSNLHCSSCVHAIEDALSSLSPPPTSVEVSIVTQSVTVCHHPTLAPTCIKVAIDEAGFDIIDTPNDAADTRSLFPGTLSPTRLARRTKHIQQCTPCQAEQEVTNDTTSVHQRDKLDECTLFPDVASSSVPAVGRSEQQAKALIVSPTSVLPTSPSYGGPYNLTLSIGGMTCASCSNTVTRCVSELPGVSDVVVNLIGSSATLKINQPDQVPVIIETIEDGGYEAEVVSVEPVNPPERTLHLMASKEHDGPFLVSLSIGGMTCVACVTTITNLASGIAGVSEVAVNLLGKSATAIVARKDLVDQLFEAIEDAGYEPEVIGVDPLGEDNQDKLSNGPRTVALRVDGMFCSHCPERVMAVLEQFQSHITMIQPISTYTDPIIKVSYLPDPPAFTIRTLIAAISATSSPSSTPFTASIYHPPSLEARARHMQRREQRSLLLRLAFSVIVAIPTFIIAIVYMSLLPSSNPTRAWFMRPMWAGNASRVEWALFFLATPVMFYSAGSFHRRSLKELWALWRKGSRTPVWKRFIRFGSMNLLVSTGVSVAYFASIALLALAATQPASPTGQGDTTTYFDSVVLLTMFLLAGRFLEAYSKGHTADAISALGRLRPTTALLLAPGDSHDSTPAQSVSAASSRPELPHNLPLELDLEKGATAHSLTERETKAGARIESVNAELLEVGDVVRVQHGGSPPADGTVLVGDGGAFDESSLTGESKLVKKNIGEKVFVGTINKGKVVDIRVDAIGGETMLDRVVKIVREGQTRRAPIERIADLLTGYFVPVVTLLAILTWVIWLSLGLSGSLPRDYLDIGVGSWPVWSLEFAIAVFVVACPCGIGLAAPTALLVGSGLAAKHGILARGGGEAFQEAAQLDLVVFDKTGTLTEGGEPRVIEVEIVPQASRQLSNDVVLGIAAEVESGSSHPLAAAIRQYCEENHATRQAGSQFEETAGRGLKARFDALQCTAIIGNEAWMEEHGCVVDGRLQGRLSAWKSGGNSVVLLGVGNDVDVNGAKQAVFAICAAFAVADPLRPEAKSIVAWLQAQGIGTWMISGDNAVTAGAVAHKVGIPATNVIAGVLPHEKAEKILWLQLVGMKKDTSRWQGMIGKRRLNGRCIVAMIGDGINDAPALTASDVGIAIGSGSDVAISSASFILLSSNLSSLITLLDLSRTVFNRVKFNFLWATIYNLIALPIAAGVVYPAGHARLAPVWASLAMALSSVSVVCSSLLLKLYKEPQLARNC